ncbi:Ser/Thr protein kinase RdoA (MazF antagonist) [Actinoalloteichus hoggarensis]|uniref:phosphotransferase enzyme family protein n=1 Tax=Actinoalloteichus hoggarensis TaxID=1470176 RepID=UPI00184FC98A|nr:phosphotransferase [Actinoalloteichus hoggarensis]MBB5922156.1 Ser/Thr protein kinase RdoA (MazF antagonist) [Actinoalloteichus hoggarensis]
MGVSTAGAQLIRDGTNVMYRLPGAVVARIGPAGSHGLAERQITASRWLADAGIPVVQVLDGVEQPTLVGDRPVTWWVTLPEHRHAEPAELGAMLRRLHELAVPESALFPEVDPLDGLYEAIRDGSPLLAQDDRRWLQDLVDSLRADYGDVAQDLPRHVIHGDAWQGNVVVVDPDRPVLLDLDHFGIGPWEWDLISLAVDYTDFARITPTDYRAFVEAYGGYDMTAWPGYRTLATIREVRWATFALSKATTDDEVAKQARHRVACLRGVIDRPWTWTAL